MKLEINTFDFAVIFTIIFSNIVFYDTDVNNLFLAISILFLCALRFIKPGFSATYFSIFITIAVGILIAVTKQYNQISLVILLLLYLLARSNIDLINLDLYINLSVGMFLIIIVSYFLFGLNTDKDTTIWRSVENQLFYRKSLGYSHSNVAVLKWMVIVMAIFTKGTSRDAVKKTLPILIITYLIYNVTVSRTSTAIIGIYCLSILLFRKKLHLQLNNILKRTLALSPIFYTWISLLLVKLTENEWINNLLSGRLIIYSNALNTYGITLLGNSEIEKLMFDNAYLHMLLGKGIIFMIAYFILFYLIINNANCITFRDLILILGFLTAGLMETLLLKFEFLILIIIILYRPKSETLKPFSKKEGILLDGQKL